MSDATWPPWWHLELEITDHVRDRMLDRNFTEVELREMLEDAEGRRHDLVPGRWVIETRWHRRPWEVIVEPRLWQGKLFVITAYMVE